jgi:hypothetical protein
MRFCCCGASFVHHASPFWVWEVIGGRKFKATQEKTYNHKSAWLLVPHWFSACTPYQFECRCGTPRCISNALVHDRKKNCADGSDESPSSSKLCADGKLARNTSALSSSPSFAAGPPMVPCGEMANQCRERLGEMCLVSWCSYCQSNIFCR